MFGRFHRFRFDEESTFETFCTGIVASDGEHHGQMLFLPFLIGIEQRHITFAAAPEYIIRSAQFDGCVDGVFDLYGSAGYDIKVGVGSRTVHIAGVAEYIGSTPQ